MKRVSIILAMVLCSIVPLCGAEIEAITYNALVASISRAREPVVSGKYVIFTASGNARYVAIAFAHENYTKTHTFQRIIHRDELGNPQKDESGKPLETVLFYIATIPPGTKELRYRMVIDGLWTTDPLNSHTEYDHDNRMDVSILPVDYYEVFNTQPVRTGVVHFSYFAKSGSIIRVAGSFNNWDPFMYELHETIPGSGKYELELSLPPGIWYYAYFEGTTQIPDNTNPDRVYTQDGRIASVITVK